MATDVAGLVIGAVGLVTLVNTVESCINGYEKFIISAEETAVSKETGRLALYIRLEQRKFDLYWKYTGLSKTDCPLLRAQSLTTQKLIIDVVNEICCLLSDSTKLVQDYGFTVTKDWDMKTPASSSATNNSLYTIYQSMRNYSWYGAADSTVARSTVSASRRIRWVWKDHTKAVALLDHLRRYNHELYTYLSPKHEFLLKLGEPSFLLPGFNDPDFLQSLVKRSSAGPSDGPFASASELRRSLINFSNGDQEHRSLSTSLMISARDIWITERLHPNVQRDIGSFNGEKVIIEYKYIDPTLQDTQQNEIRERLKQLIRLLSQQYHSDFRFLRALGMYEDPRDKHRYGLVFKACKDDTTDALALHSLSSLLVKDSIAFNLGARFKLALALCIAIMQLHAAGWLHKSITPENILFTTNSSSASPDISEPYLTGFELTRPDRPSEQSLDVPTPHGNAVNLFVHPERQGLSPARYRKQHDYYALGMCLLCIGAWQSPSKLWKAFEAKVPRHECQSGAWAEYAIGYAGRRLGPICGEVFRDAVLVCLSGKYPLPAGSDEDTADRDLQTAFFSVVIRKLAECYA